MDAKRKAQSQPDERTPKRQKLPTDAIDASEETAETTTESGLKFIESLKNSKDKFGRPIATEFMSLPDPRRLPEYYSVIQMPISIDTMEDKLRRREYPNLTSLESDLKRMIANAKLFNDRQSAIFEDAERVRKSAVNFFTRFNPAYHDPQYQAAPTPIPADYSSIPRPSIKARPRSSIGPTPSKSNAPAPATATSSASPAPPVVTSTSRKPGKQNQVDDSGDNGDSSDFVGKTFLQAQHKILEELLHYTEDDLEIFASFANLPSRQLTDYYDLIGSNATCLKLLQKRVKGIHGRTQATWHSDYQSWKAFEDAVAFIWKNAQLYNEDGSDLYILADQFKEQFLARLEDAKAVVEQPPQPKLKLNMSAGPRLNITMKEGASKSPGVASQQTTPGPERVSLKVNMDSKANLPVDVPKAEPTATANGIKPSTSSSSVPTIGGLATQPNGVSSESQAAVPNGVRAPVQPSTTQPATQGLRPPSASPYPGLANGHQTHGHHSALASLHSAANEPFSNKIRPVGETAADSILPRLTLSSHPNLQLQNPFNLTIPASETMTQQSITLTLPGTHTHLQVKPYIPPEITARPYRTFVLVNGRKESRVIKPAAETDLSHPLFEVRLERGAVNRIEVEVLAGKEVKTEAKTDSKESVPVGKKQDVELEKCTIFVHVMPF